MDLYNKINTNKISHMEYLWFESCFNSGLTYLQKKDEIYNCYGYDFSLNDPSLIKFIVLFEEQKMQFGENLIFNPPLIM